MTAPETTVEIEVSGQSPVTAIQSLSPLVETVEGSVARAEVDVTTAELDSSLTASGRLAVNEMAEVVSSISWEDFEVETISLKLLVDDSTTQEISDEPDSIEAAEKPSQWASRDDIDPVYVTPGTALADVMRALALCETGTFRDVADCMERLGVDMSAQSVSSNLSTLYRDYGLLQRREVPEPGTVTYTYALRPVAQEMAESWVNPT